MFFFLNWFHWFWWKRIFPHHKNAHVAGRLKEPFGSPKLLCHPSFAFAVNSFQWKLFTYLMPFLGCTWSKKRFRFLFALIANANENWPRKLRRLCVTVEFRCFKWTGQGLLSHQHNGFGGQRPIEIFEQANRIKFTSLISRQDRGKAAEV